MRERAAEPSGQEEKASSPRGQERTLQDAVRQRPPSFLEEICPLLFVACLFLNSSLQTLRVSGERSEGIVVEGEIQL